MSGRKPMKQPERRDRDIAEAFARQQARGRERESDLKRELADTRRQLGVALAQLGKSERHRVDSNRKLESAVSLLVEAKDDLAAAHAEIARLRARRWWQR